ncbi:MAG: hypothetical protein LLG44_10040 [Chloroflexi bacterium]|nr:hypothetical protein [Chloroflexota bacterium]
MARRATYIRQAKSETTAPLVILDSGDALFGTSLSISAQGEPIIEAMNALGYDAMGIGAQDLLLGLDTLLARRDQAVFPFLSANLVKADGTLVFEPYVIINKGNMRIGVISVIEPIEEILTHAPDVQGVLNTLDAADVVKRYAAELDGKVDVVVVLSHLGIARDKTLAQISGVDVIIGGGDRTLMDEPVRAGNAIIVQQGYQGEWIGRTILSLDEQGQMAAATTEYIALGPDVADDVDMAKLIERWDALYPTPTPSE